MKTESTVNPPVRILSLEDSPQDYEIIREQLVNAGYNLQMDHAVNESEYLDLLQNRDYDIILADFRLAGFDAFGALQHALERCPEVPFICVSGSIGEETAIELIKQGAVDYVLKDRPEGLPYAVERALSEAGDKKKRLLAEEELRASEQKYRLLTENTFHVSSVRLKREKA